MKPKTFLAKSIATLLATTITLTSALHALPQGEQVQAGSASFSRAGGALDIRTSDRAIINYQSFSIGSAERVNFIQPSVQSITLNRVTAPNPSQIFGTLTSNGQIVLANPYGIFFQSGSVVNVGGIIAGAGQISNSDFLAGRINFSSLSGDVENHGNITAVTDVGLYGEHVANTGSISSQKGSVTLAAGSSVYVGEAGGNIFVGSAAAIPKARVVSKPGVSNTGRITAPKTNLVAGDMYGIAIAQSGDIISGDITIAAGVGGSVDVSGRLDASNRAPGKTGGKIKVKGDTVTVHDATLDASGSAGGGTIVLEGGHNPTMPTTVTSSGRLLARGEGAGAKGGTVQMTGDHVGLLGNAVVDVSGDAGGGTALIGGDYQGRNPNVQNAERTYISLGAQIYADALTIGDGGKVVVWADEITRYFGHVSVRGGARGGDGGFAEISGKQFLTFRGTADGTAKPGFRGGKILLDPQDIIINNTGTDAVTNQAAGTADLAFNAPDLVTDVTFDPSASGAFDGFAEVNLQANRDILIQSAFNVKTAIGAGTNASLVLAAGRNINVGAAITSGKVGANEGNITLLAGDSIALGANIITDNAGAITIRASATDVQLGFNATGFNQNLAGTITRTAGSVQAGTGLVTLSAGGGITATTNAPTITFANITGGVTITNTNAVGLTVSGTNAGAGAVSITETAGSMTLGGASGIVTNSGAVTLIASALNKAIDASAKGVSTIGGATVGAAITLQADNMILGATADNLNAGTGLVTLRPTTNATVIQLGNGVGADAAGFLRLTDTELATVTSSGGLTLGSAANTGGITVGGALDLLTPGKLTGGTLTLQSNTGTIAVNATLTSPVVTTLTTASGNITFGAAGLLDAGANTVNLTATAGDIQGNAAVFNNVNAATLNATASSGIGAANAIESTAGVLTFTNTANAVQVTNTLAGGVTVSGTNAGTGAVSITETAGALAVGLGDINTNGGAVTLFASALNKAISSVVGADIITTGGGGNGAVTLQSDNMSLAGAITSGAGLVTLKPTTNATVIQVGNGAGADAAGFLRLTDTELATITTSGGLTVGSAANTGGITVVGALDLVAPANLTGGTLTLQSNSGNIAVNATLISPVSTTLTTASGDITFDQTAGNVTAAGKTVTLTATAGKIDMSGAAANFTNVSATTLVATSNTGIGAGGTLQTDVGKLTVSNAGAGPTGNIDITNVQSLTFNTATGSSVSNNAVGGNISVTVSGTNNDITFSGGATPMSGTGNITLVAADQIVFSQGATVIAINATGGASVVALTAGNVGASTNKNIVGNAAAATDVNGATLNLISVSGIGAVNAIQSTVGTLTFSNTTGAVQVSNTLAGGVTVSGTNAGAGAVNITETAGNLTLAGASGIVSNSGAVTLFASAADKAIDASAKGVSTIGGATAGAAITLQADNMILGVAANNLNAGTGLVTLKPTSADDKIQVGLTAADATGVGTRALGLTGVELQTITTSGGLTIGDGVNTGGITVVGAVTGANLVNLTGGTLTLQSGSGNIALNAALTSPVNTTLTTASGNITFGATGLVDAGANTVNLTATAGDIQGNAAAFNNVNAGMLNLTASSGIGALNAIESTVGILTFSNTTNSVQVTNTKGAGLGVAGTNAGVGLVKITETAGNLTLAGASGIVSNSGAVTLFASAADKAIDASAKGVSTIGGATAGAAITLQADNMILGATAGNLNAGTGLVTLKAAATGAAIQVGATAADGAGVLGLTGVELQTVTTSGGMTIGDGVNTGGITVVGAVTGANLANLTGGTLTLQTNSGNIALNAALTSPVNTTLTTASGNITVGGNVNVGTKNLSLLASGAASNIVAGVGTLTAGTLTLNAGGGIGGAAGTNPILTAASNLVLTSGGVGAAGDISVKSANAVGLNSVTTNVGSVQTVTLEVTTGDFTATGTTNLGADNLTIKTLAGNIEGGAGSLGTTTGTLTLNASGGIGVTTPLNTSVTTGNILLTTAGVGALGNISIVEANALATSRVTVTTAASTQTVSLSAPAITLDAVIGAATDNLTLVASNVVTGTVSGASLVTANDLRIDAVNGIGTAVATPVNVAVTGNLSAQLTGGVPTGDIFIKQGAGNLTIGTANGLSGILSVGRGVDVRTVDGTLNVNQAVNAAAGNLTLVSGETVEATVANVALGANVTGGTVVIQSVDDITRSAGTVSATDLLLDAANGIGLTGARVATSVTNLAARITDATATGDIFVTETAGGGAMVVNTVVGVVGVATTNNRSIALSTTSGGITLTQGVSANGSGNVTLIAGGAGNIMAGAGRVSTGSGLVDLRGTGVGTTGAPVLTGLGTGTFVATSTGAVGAGDIAISNNTAGGLNTTQLTGFTTAGTVQTIQVTQTAGNITVGGNVNVGTDNLSLLASGAAANIVAGAGTLTAGTLTLNANGGIGGAAGTNPILTAASNLVLTSGGVGAAGDISVKSANAVGLNSVSTNAGSVQTVTLVVTTGDFTATGTTNLGTDNLTIQTLAGNIEGGAGSLGTTGILNLDASGGIGVTTPLNTNLGGTGTLTLKTNGLAALGNIRLVEAAALNSIQISPITLNGAGHSITFTSTVGPITINAGSPLNLGTNDLTLITTAGNIALAADVTAGTLRLGSAGNISQTTGKISATNLGMRAATGIDVYSATNDAVNLAAVNTVSGRIEYQDANGLTVNVGGVTGTADFAAIGSGVTQTTTAAGNDILIKTLTGTLTLSNDVLAGTGLGDVRLFAAGADIAQAAAGSRITANNLGLRSATGADVYSATNDAVNLAAVNTVSGRIEYQDANGLTVSAAGIGAAHTADFAAIGSGVTQTTTAAGNDILIKTLTGTLTLSNDVLAGTGLGDVRLFAAGADIAQAAAGSRITANNLGLRSATGADVYSATNDAVNLAAVNTVSGRIEYQDANALTVNVGGVTGTADFAAIGSGVTQTTTAAGNDILIKTLTGTLTLSNDVLAGTGLGDVRLFAAGADIAQAAAGSRITANNLGLRSATGADVYSATNDAVNLAAVNTVSGRIEYQDANGLTVSAAGIGAAHTADFAAIGSGVTQTTTAAGNDILIKTLTGTLTLSNDVLAGTGLGDVRLFAAGADIAQAAAGSRITANNLGLRSATGADVYSATNDAVNLAAVNTVSGRIEYQDANALTVNVGGVTGTADFAAIGSGVTQTTTAAGNDILIKTLTGTLTLSNDVLAGTGLGDVRLFAAGADIAQAAAGSRITANNLGLRSATGADVYSATNDAVNLAAVNTVSGRIEYQDANGLTVSAAGIGAAHTADFAAIGSGVTQTTTAAGNDILIKTLTGTLTLSNDVLAGTGLGDVRLFAAGADIAQAAAGSRITANNLGLRSATGADVYSATNDAVNLAAVNTVSGRIEYQDANGLTVSAAGIGAAHTADFAAIGSGVTQTTTAAGNDILIKTLTGTLTLSNDVLAGTGLGDVRLFAAGADIAQAAAGSRITANNLGLRSATGADVYSATNDAVNLAAVNTVSGRIEYQDANGLTVSAAGIGAAHTADFAAIGSGVTQTTTAAGNDILIKTLTGTLTLSNDVLAGTGLGDVRLFAAGADIAQAAAGSRITANNLGLRSATGADVYSATNDAVNLAAVNTVSGRIEYQDANGLTVSAAGIGAAHTADFAAIGSGVTQTTTAAGNDILIKTLTGTLTLSNDVLAGTGLGDVRLFAAGADIAQAAAGSRITANNLGLRSATGADVYSATNDAVNLAAVNTVSGRIEYQDANGLTVSAAGIGAAHTADFAAIGSGVTQTTTAAGNDILIKTLTGTLTLSNDVLAGTGLGDVRLFAAGADIAQAAAGSRITANNLGLRSATGADVYSATNDAVNLAAVNTVSGRIEYQDANGLTVSAAGIGAAHTADFAAIGSGVTQTTTAAGNDILIKTLTGTLTLSNDVLAGTGAGGLVQLDAVGLLGVINQTVGSRIGGLSLIARATDNVTLTQPSNDVMNLAGSSVSGTFSYRDATAVIVGTINDGSPVPVAVVGLTTANRDISVASGAGLVSGGVAINSVVNAGLGVLGGIVRLETVQGDITQTAAITASSLLANALAGSVSLGGATNNVAVSLAGSAGATNGSFRFLNAAGITVDSIPGDAITAPANGIKTNNGDVAILTGGTLTLNGPIDAANGGPVVAGTSGTVRLRTTAGDITQTAAGPILADRLLLNANGGVFLSGTGAANDVFVLAGSAGLAGFAYQDINGVTVGNVTQDGFPGTFPTPPFLDIPGINSISTTGPLTLTSGGVLNFSVPLILGGPLVANAPIIDINGGGLQTIRTVGGQTYNGAVVLTDHAVLTDLAPAGAIRFLSTVDSDLVMPWSLTVNTAGITEFNGLVGNTRALLSVDTDVFGSVRFNATGTDLAPTVRTTTSQTYRDAAVLALDTVLSSTLGGDLTFGSIVDSEVGTVRSLRVNSMGNEIFSGVVGGSFALLSLVADGDAALRGGQAQFNMTAPGLGTLAGVNAGSVTVNDTAVFNVGVSTTANPSVQTTGGAADAQTYNGAVILNADTVLKDTANANIVFNSTVNSDTAGSPRALEVDTGGDEVFAGRVGNTFALRTLITDASNAGGNARFNAIGTTLGASVITTGLQTYNDDVRLGTDVVLQSTGSGFITFNRTVNSDTAGTARALEVNTGGEEVFNGRVGDAAPLRTLITDASNVGGNARFNAVGAMGAASVITTGLQTYNDDVRLGTDVVLQSTGSGDIRFNGTVNSDTAGPARALEVNTGGDEVFNGRVGNTFALRTLITDASNVGGNARFNAIGTTLAASVITTLLQTYNDDVRLGTDVVLQSTVSGDIRFNRTVNSDTAGPARALEVNTGGDEVFFGRVGDAAALRTLITDASNLGGNARFNAMGTTGAASVTTTELQTYNDDVRLGTDVVLQSTGSGSIRFNRTVNSDTVATPRALEVNTGGVTGFGDGGADNVGGIAALRSLLTDAGGTTEFNIAGGTSSVLTTNMQTYNDAVRLVRDTVLTSDSDQVTAGIQGSAPANDIRFNSTVDSFTSADPRSLTVNTSGVTRFGNGVGLEGDRVGGINALLNLTTDAGGGTVFNVVRSVEATVTTTKVQDFRDSVTLNQDTLLLSTAGGDINLRSTVEANNHALQIHNIGANPANPLVANAILGATIFNLAGLYPQVAGTTTIGTAGTATIISTNSVGPNGVPSDMLFIGPVEIQGNVTLAVIGAGATAANSSSFTAAAAGNLNSGKKLTFLSTVKGPGNLTVTAEGVVAFAGTVGGGNAPLGSLDVTAPIIQIQSTRTQNDLRLRTTLASGSDGSDGLVVLMGNTYTSDNGNVLLNWDNRPVLSKHATILSTAGDLNISAAGQFFMGSQQKLLVNNGGLTITAGGAATLGDLAALTSIRLTASSVFLQGRPLSGITNQNRTDKGLGFVSPSISFNTSSMAFLSGTNQKAVFATKDSIASVPGTQGVSLELDKDIVNQFGQQDILGQVSLGIMQPIASGTLVTEPSKIQVVFVLEIPKLVELPETTFLSRADQDVLAKMGIYPREATSDENITVSLRRGVFRQPIEGKAQMDDPEYKVVVNRLTTAEVKAIVDAYTELAGKDFENLKKIATILAEQVNKYQTATPGALGLEGFTKWLQAQRAGDKTAEELSKNLDELASVFVRLARIGLTKKEVMICKLKICDELKEFLPNVDVWDVVPLVEGGANPPIAAPRPAMTAPPVEVPPPAANPPADGTPAPLPQSPLPPPPESVGTVPADAASPVVPTPPALDAPSTPKAQ